MAVLNITWESLDRVSPKDAQATGTEAAAATTPKAAEKPMMIWIEDPVDAEENEKLSKVVLDPDKVRVGASYFRCAKMTEDQAKADPLLADAGEKLPRLVFVGVDWKVVEVIDGKISSSKIFDAMVKVAKKAYDVNFEKNVKSVIKILGELDKIADERKVIEDKEKKDPKPAEVKELAKQKAELDAHEKEILDQRKELLSPPLKTA